MIPSPVSRSFIALTSVHFLKQHCTVHTDMNLEMHFRTLAVITIKGVCALLQQKKMTVEDKVRSLTSLILSQLGFSSTAEIDDIDIYMYLPKTKNFDCVGRGDLTSLFFSKVAKLIEVRGDLSSNVENKKSFASRPSGMQRLCLSTSLMYF